jgi:hypothetical protein
LYPFIDRFTHGFDAHKDESLKVQYFLAKPNQKLFQIVSDMMDFRSYSSSSNEVIVKTNPTRTQYY